MRSDRSGVWRPDELMLRDTKGFDASGLEDDVDSPACFFMIIGKKSSRACGGKSAPRLLSFNRDGSHEHRWVWPPRHC